MGLQRVHRFVDPKSLFHEAVGLLARRIVELQRHSERVHLALAGGQTVTRMYAALAELGPATTLNPRKIELWWASESYVGASNQLRNSTQALSMLAKSFPIVPAQTHPMPMPSTTADPHQAALDYAAELGEQRFDLCLLGLGADGSVAGIFPRHPSANAALDSGATVIGVVDAPEEASEQISLTFNAINRSREVWVIVTGTKKADALARVLNHDPALPGSFVHGSERTEWIVDMAAAAQLPYYECQL